MLYIAGTGRSGSTLLGSSLGQVDGFWSVGELRHIWERGIIGDWRCGCGLYFSQCPTWEKILSGAFGGRQLDAGAVARSERRLTRVRHIPLVLLSQRRPELIDDRVGDYRSYLDRLYRSVRSVTGADVIVDSSKSPTYGYLLRTIPSIDLSVVHLVRDPRASAYSWTRRRERNDAGRERRYMDVMGTGKSSVLWALWNTLTEVVLAGKPTRYIRLRYEDLMKDTRGSLTRILEMVGSGDARLPFLQSDVVELQPSHSISGNPMRMQHGRVEVKPDVEWIERMNTRDRLLVAALTGPVMGRYGYPLRRQGALRHVS